MKTTLNVLSLSAGLIEENKMLYASMMVLDSNLANQIDHERIDVGQKHAKIKIDTSNNNELARSLAKSGLIPGNVTVELDTSVKKNELTMTVKSFEHLPGK